jgi:FixJ family two-component response regulator
MAVQSSHLSLKLMTHQSECKIYIIDDDESVRRGLSLLLLSNDYNVETHENTKEFLRSVERNHPGCVLLDVFLDEGSGLELQAVIKERFPYFPIIYITGHGDIPMSVKALKQGAFNFLEKPIDDKILLQVIKDAITNSLDLFGIQKEKNIIQEKFDSLTSRELEIFKNVIKGKLNKQIAAELDIAEHTVKLHRGKITEKLGVKSVPEMIYLLQKTDLKQDL